MKNNSKNSKKYTKTKNFSRDRKRGMAQFSGISYLFLRKSIKCQKVTKKVLKCRKLAKMENITKNSKSTRKTDNEVWGYFLLYHFFFLRKVSYNFSWDPNTILNCLGNQVPKGVKNGIKNLKKYQSA